MNTERLIDSLAAGLTPVSPRQVWGRLAAPAAAGGLAALVLAQLWLGLRPDLVQAIAGATFWMKTGYAVVVGLGGFWCAERLARPVGSPRLGLSIAVAAFGLLLILGLAQLAVAPPQERLAAWLGGSWRRCPFNILALSAPTLVLVLLGIRRLAPTRLALAGAAAGLFAGGVAATAYALHCPETAPAFVATWYTFGMALSSALGAALGPWALRWR